MSTGQIRPTDPSLYAAVAFLCGLLTLVLCWIPLVGILAFPLGTIALVTAALAIRGSRTHANAGRSIAIAGLVTGVIGLTVATYLLVVFLLGFRGPAWEGDVNDVRALFPTESR